MSESLRRSLLDKGAEYDMSTQTIVVSPSAYRELETYLDVNKMYNGYTIKLSNYIESNRAFVVDEASDLFNIDPIAYENWSKYALSDKFNVYSSPSVYDSNAFYGSLGRNPHTGSNCELEDVDNMTTIEGRRLVAERLASNRVETREPSNAYMTEIPYVPAFTTNTRDIYSYNLSSIQNVVNSCHLDMKYSREVGSTSAPYKLTKGAIQLVITKEGWYAFAHLPKEIFEYEKHHGIIDFDKNEHPVYFKKSQKVK